MGVRIKDWQIPYTWGIGIEITENHIINVLLREMNNLIMVNEDNELYVDLQLPDGIEPDDDFPVGVTTWKILAEDWRPQSWTILNRKTTSWDYCRLIYANDGNLYLDPWTWERILIWWDAMDCNVRKFLLTDLSDTTVGQRVTDWYRAGKYPVVVYGWNSYLLGRVNSSTQVEFLWHWTTINNYMNAGHTDVTRGKLQATWDADGVFQWWLYEGNKWVVPPFLRTDIDYSTPYTPQYNGSPATKKYVDDWLALKQDILTAWNNITISNNVISADLANVYTYKGSVADYNSLPSSWMNVWDVWLALDTGISYAWNGTSWISMWSSVNLSDYFNKVQDTTDDITQGTYNLFVTAAEKALWSGKQDALVAGTDITIDPNTNVISATPYTAGTWISIGSHVVTNTLPFEPENSGTLGQVLRKTSTGYNWSNEIDAVTSVNWRTWAVTVNEVPNGWSTGQVLKKTSTGYSWQNESWWGWWGWSYIWGYWINIDSNDEISNTLAFDPSNSWSEGQVLTKTSSGYRWQTAAAWWVTSVNGRTWAVTVDEFSPTSSWSTGQVLTKTANGYTWQSSDSSYVKVFVLTATPSQSDLKAVVDWLLQWVSYWAIIRRTDTDDVCVFQEAETSGSTTEYKFISSRVHIKTTNWQQWDWTTLCNNLLVISVTSNTYSMRYSDWSTQANFLLTQQAQDYNTPYMPTSDWQPATKKYVDTAVQAATGWGITNNTTGTTTTVAQIRAWTESQYNSLSSKSSSTIYYVF